MDKKNSLAAKLSRIGKKYPRLRPLVLLLLRAGYVVSEKWEKAKPLLCRGLAYLRSPEGRRQSIALGLVLCMLVVFAPASLYLAEGEDPPAAAEEEETSGQEAGVPGGESENAQPGSLSQEESASQEQSGPASGGEESQSDAGSVPQSVVDSQPADSSASSEGASSEAQQETKLPPVAIAFAAQPASAEADPEETVTFRAEAYAYWGAEELTEEERQALPQLPQLQYQWQRGTLPANVTAWEDLEDASAALWQDIPGATGEAYSHLVVEQDLDAAFRCVVKAGDVLAVSDFARVRPRPMMLFGAQATYMVSFHTYNETVDPVWADNTYPDPLPDPGAPPAASGGRYFEFGGWYTAEGGRGTAAVAGGALAQQQDHTLYAYWKCKGSGNPPIATVSVQLYNGSERVGSTSMTPGAPYNLGRTPPAVEGKDFIGWSRYPLGGTLLTADMIVPHNSNGFDMFAQYETSKYNITLELHGGSVGNGVTEIPFEHGTTYGNVLRGLPIPTRTDYYFDGWFKDEHGTPIGGSTVPLLGPMTVHANWTYTGVDLTLNLRGGNIGGDEGPVPYHVTYKEPYGLLPEPLRANYRFVGWSTSDTQTQLVTAQTIVNQGDHPLYAVWAETVLPQISITPLDGANPALKQGRSRYQVDVTEQHADDSGLAQVEVTLTRGGQTVPLGSLPTLTPGADSYSYVVELSTTGEYTIAVAAQDREGNQQTASLAGIAIDTSIDDFAARVMPLPNPAGAAAEDVAAAWSDIVGAAQFYDGLTDQQRAFINAYPGGGTIPAGSQLVAKVEALIQKVGQDAIDLLRANGSRTIGDIMAAKGVVDGALALRPGLVLTDKAWLDARVVQAQSAAGVADAISLAKTRYNSNSLNAADYEGIAQLAARYEALSAEAKTLVQRESGDLVADLGTLQAARTAAGVIKAGLAAVHTPYIPQDLAVIEQLRGDYQSTTAQAKSLLENAEQTRATAAIADAAAARPVLDAIEALNRDDATAVAQTQADYIALTEAQKRLIPDHLKQKLAEAVDYAQQKSDAMAEAERLIAEADTLKTIAAVRAAESYFYDLPTVWQNQVANRGLLPSLVFAKNEALAILADLNALGSPYVPADLARIEALKARSEAAQGSVAMMPAADQARLAAAIADGVAARPVQTAIEQLGAEDHDNIPLVAAQFAALSAQQKNLISQAMREKLAQAQAYVDSRAAAIYRAEALINTANTLHSIAAVNEAEAYYNGMRSNWKPFVSNVALLEALKLERSAAQTLSLRIGGVKPYTAEAPDSTVAIAQLENDFANAAIGVRRMVPQADKDLLTTMVADRDAALAVRGRITALHEGSDPGDVGAAGVAYDALSAEQKLLIAQADKDKLAWLRDRMYHAILILRIETAIDALPLPAQLDNGTDIDALLESIAAIDADIAELLASEGGRLDLIRQAFRDKLADVRTALEELIVRRAAEIEGKIWNLPDPMHAGAGDENEIVAVRREAEDAGTAVWERISQPAKDRLNQLMVVLGYRLYEVDDQAGLNLRTSSLPAMASLDTMGDGQGGTVSLTLDYRARLTLQARSASPGGSALHLFNVLCWETGKGYYPAFFFNLQLYREGWEIGGNASYEEYLPFWNASWVTINAPFVNGQFREIWMAELIGDEARLMPTNWNAAMEVTFQPRAGALYAIVVRPWETDEQPAQQQLLPEEQKKPKAAAPRPGSETLESEETLPMESVPGSDLQEAPKPGSPTDNGLKPSAGPGESVQPPAQDSLLWVLLLGGAAALLVLALMLLRRRGRRGT